MLVEIGNLNYEFLHTSCLDELAIWLIPISIAIFFVKYYAIYLVSLYIVYFVTVRALEKIQVSNLQDKAVLITG